MTSPDATTTVTPTTTGGPFDPAPFDPRVRYRLDPQVALRPEPFGALAYHYGNRRLTLLRAPELVRMVQGISDHPNARAAYDAAGVAPARWSSFEKALSSLARSGFLREAGDGPLDAGADDERPVAAARVPVVGGRHPRGTTHPGYHHG